MILTTLDLTNLPGKVYWMAILPPGPEVTAKLALAAYGAGHLLNVQVAVFEDEGRMAIWIPDEVHSAAYEEEVEEDEYAYYEEEVCNKPESPEAFRERHALKKAGGDRSEWLNGGLSQYAEDVLGGDLPDTVEAVPSLQLPDSDNPHLKPRAVEDDIDETAFEASIREAKARSKARKGAQPSKPVKVTRASLARALLAVPPSGPMVWSLAGFYAKHPVWRDFNGWAKYGKLDERRGVFYAGKKLAKALTEAARS